MTAHDALAWLAAFGLLAAFWWDAYATQDRLARLRERIESLEARAAALEQRSNDGEW